MAQRDDTPAPTSTANESPIAGPRPAQPKRYSTVNISKKFLEKNSATTSPSSSAPSASVPKSISRTPTQTPASQSHSKLVTAKLTAPATSSATQGWSRPTSTAAPSSSSPPPNPAPPVTSQKSLHPQQRPPNAHKDPSKPAWGSLKSTSSNTRIPSAADFPTAAEVAQGASDRRVPKEQLPNPDLEQAAETTRLREKEAATFRGAHLDPNAHHWDDLDEDDDNFLDGVLEFGDGKQYQIASAGLDKKPQLGEDLVESPKTDGLKVTPDIPVSKEERFAEDFDRSWPRSRQPPPAAPIREPKIAGPVPPARPTILTSEQSRVLFNERSNKLEPYNNGTRPAVKKPGFPDTPSPTDTRGNVQLLHKPAPERTRSGGSFGPERPRDREPLPRERGFPNDIRGGRRMSNMGPPPVPLHRRAGSDSRQAPQAPAESLAPPRRSPSQDRTTTNPDSVHPPSTTTDAPQTTLTSQVSPAVEYEEIEEARKGVMQHAAERAKQRRQQEEEERAKQQERAREKAAELEAKMLAAAPPPPDPPKPSPAPESRNHANPPNVQPEAAASSPVDSSRRRPSMKGEPRRPSIQESPRPSFSRRDSKAAPPPPPDTPAEKPGSWRMKSSPRITTAPLPDPKPSRPPVPVFDKLPSALDHVEAIAEESADLEVVDFTDIGLFLGIEPSSPEDDAAVEDTPNDTKPEPETSLPQTPPHSPVTAHIPSSLEHQAPPSPDSANLWRRTTTTSEPEHSHDVSAIASYPWPQSSPQSNVIQRSPAPKGTPYTEAAMSSLDDAMSRIKATLTDMKEHQKPSPPRASPPRGPISTKPDPTVTLPTSWAPGKEASPPTASSPPAERWRSTFQTYAVLPEAREALVTVGERPGSPKPAWNVRSVRIPKGPGAARETIAHKQLLLATKPSQPFRWDILTFVPPVQGMNKRTLSVNDVLFRAPTGKPRFKVQLPNSSDSSSLIGAKVKIPLLGRTASSGAFGKPSIADGAGQWRRAAPAPRIDLGDVSVEGELHTTSRSPPPELPSTVHKASLDSRQQPLKAKSHSKIPDGASVGFYKNSPLESESGVKFTVSSDLDPLQPNGSSSGNSAATSVIGGHLSSSDAPAVSRRFPNGHKLSPHSPEYSMPSLNVNKAESKSSQDSTDRMPLTPPNPSVAPWARSPSITLPVKESPSRIPDPELLKAVWSQTSDQSNLPSVNSLEGIADDMSGVPFTIQDVKSEDGETPPPTAPSRMSLHDVTRAFQQVPSSSSGSPPKTTAAVSRPQGTFPANSTPLSAPAPGRPSYTPFLPASANSQPPPNNQVYAQQLPQQARMTPMYGGPLWMPMPPPNLPQQGHAPGMRPMQGPFTPGSPYPGQMMAYPGPGTPPMYHMAPAPQPNGQNRGVHGMPMMSPVLNHASAHAMYHPGSPAMMHASPVQGYIPGRPPGPPGPARPDHAPAPPHFIPQGYPPLGSPQYGRPGGW